MLSVELAAIRKHGIEFCQRRGAPDPAERHNRLRADCGIVHRADRMQSVRGSKCFARQRARRN